MNKLILLVAIPTKEIPISLEKKSIKVDFNIIAESFNTYTNASMAKKKLEPLFPDYKFLIVERVLG